MASVCKTLSTGDGFYVRLNSDSLHELMGPVNQIGAISDLLARKCASQLDPEAQTLLGFVQDSSTRLHDMLAGLKTYMRVLAPATACRSCDSNVLLAAAKNSLQPEIVQSSAVITADSLPQIYCEPDQIQFIFAALIENAIKFHSGLGPEVHIAATAQAGSWTFSIRDNGPGIDPKFHDRIFATFKRLDTKPPRGAGVGLALARQIVHQHGGRIWVESQPGAGATFFFSLPMPPIDL